jgi:predicted nucleotidyltransferase
LPGKKALINSDSKSDIVLMDVSESPIQRPKKSKKPIILERKKRHTIKAQIAVDKINRKIICTAFLGFLKNLKFAYIPKSRHLKILDIRAFRKFMQIRKSPKREVKKPLAKEEKEQRIVSNKSTCGKCNSLD